MAWYAASAIDDALETTRAFLFPFGGWRWLKLAVMVFFLGGAGSGGGSFNLPSGTGNVDVPSGGGQGTGTGGGAATPGSSDIAVPEGGILGGLSDVELAGILAVIGIVLLLVLAFAVCGAVMEFVLLDALRTDEIHLRRYFRTRFGKGVRLLVFRFVVWLFVASVVGALALAWFVLAGAGSGTGGAGGIGSVLGSLAIGVPLIAAVVALGAVVTGLTTAFVAPVMIVEDRGVLAGWRRFWPVLRSEWKQYGLYLVLRLILAIAVGIATLLATAVTVVVLLIAFGLIGAIVAFALGGLEALISNTLGLAVVAVLGVLFVVCAVAAVLAIRVPVVTYFKCYALSVLGNTESAFDLLSGLRNSGDGGIGTDPTPAGD